MELSTFIDTNRAMRENSLTLFRNPQEMPYVMCYGLIFVRILPVQSLVHIVILKGLKLPRFFSVLILNHCTWSCEIVKNASTFLVSWLLLQLRFEEIVDGSTEYSDSTGSVEMDGFGPFLEAAIREKEDISNCFMEQIMSGMFMVTQVMDWMYIVWGLLGRVLFKYFIAAMQL